MVISSETFTAFTKGNLDGLYKEVYAHLIAYSSKHLGPQFDFLSEDYVQDAIFSAYQHKAELTSPNHLYSFLFTCIHNSIVTLFRKNAAQENYFDYIQEDDLSEDLMLSYVENETLSRLHNAIENLPENLQQIVKLNYEKGLKNAEVAAILGMSDSTYKRQKAELISILRKKLSDDVAMLSVLGPVIIYLSK